MAVNYNKLWEMMIDKKMSKTELTHLAGISTNSEEDAADKFPKDIAAMEQSLKRLEEQEQKYSAELDAAPDFGSRRKASIQCSSTKQNRQSAPARSRKRRIGYSRFTARSTARF